MWNQINVPSTNIKTYFVLRLIIQLYCIIWINYDIRDVIEISSKVYEVFDIFIKISLLDKIERETILRDFLEKNSKIVFDVDALVNYTDNWEVNDIKQLVKVGIFKHFLNENNVYVL